MWVESVWIIWPTRTSSRKICFLKDRRDHMIFIKASNVGERLVNHSFPHEVAHKDSTSDWGKKS